MKFTMSKKRSCVILVTLISMCFANIDAKSTSVTFIENFNEELTSVTIDNNETFQAYPEIETSNLNEIASFEKTKKFTNPAGPILEANKKILNGLVDGDIKPHLFRSVSGRRWPKTHSGRNRGLVVVPYTMSSQYNSIERGVFASAMRDIEKHTCIRFVQNSRPRARVRITNGNGCWSVIGYTGRTVIASFKIAECVNRGVVIHEMLHVLGFSHEHQRPDRSKYVSIAANNLNIVGLFSTGLLRDGRIHEQTVYDYGSIMHYNKFAYSRRFFLPTIQVYPVNGVTPSIGQRDRLSPYDIEKINYFYDCAPSTFSRCGKDFIRQSVGTFQSPNYPSRYRHNTHCTWRITVRRRRFIRLIVTNVDIEDSKYCMNDVLVVHDGRNASDPVLRRICGNHSRISLTSTQNNMYVIFSTDISKLGSGFEARFEEVAIPGVLPTKTIGFNAPPALKKTVQSFNCTFEHGLCGLSQDETDRLDFLYHNGNETVSEYDAPKHKQIPGNYIYLPWKNPAMQGDRAVIRSPWFPNGNFCVTFDYHMYGRYMGGLRLYAFEANFLSRRALLTAMWEKLGNQGDKWQTAHVEYIKSSTEKYVHFYLEGIKYRHFSVLAIDNWAINPGDCSEFANEKTNDTTGQIYIPAKGTWIRPQPIRSVNVYAGVPPCTFESRSTSVRATFQRNIPKRSSDDLGAYSFPRITRRSRFCGWRQNRQDDFDWSRRIGATPSKGTGPQQDTTSGRGNYLYIEASRKRPNEKAILESYSILPSEYCIDFNFHMKGKDIGHLDVNAIETLTNNTETTSLLLRVKSNQGQGWKNIMLDFLASNDTKSVVFRIEGVVGSSSLGDISIDDISVYPGSCDACNIAEQQSNSDRNPTFATGCVHTGLFWVRCCVSDALPRFTLRRVRNCRADMFSASVLNAYCRNQ